MAKGPTYDFDQVNLFWAGVNLDGTPATGKLYLTYNRTVPLLDDSSSADYPISIYPTRLEKTIQTAVVMMQGDNGLEERTIGYASWLVPASNDTDIQGSGGTYTLVEKLDNGLGQTRNFIADKDAVGGIWLNRISSVIPVPGETVSAVSVADMNSVKTRLTTLETSGGGGGGLTTEAVQDIVGAMILPGTGATAAYNDAAGTLTIGTTGSLDTEAVQDAVAALLSGTNGVTTTYNDATNSLVISGAGVSGLDAEGVRDAIGTAISGTGMVSVVVNDAADTIVVQGSTALTTALAAKADLSSGFLSLAQMPPGFRVTVIRVGSNWQYNGTTITARPGNRNDISIDFIGGAETDRPAWAQPGDVQKVTVTP